MMLMHPLAELQNKVKEVCLHLVSEPRPSWHHYGRNSLFGETISEYLLHLTFVYGIKYLG